MVAPINFADHGWTSMPAGGLVPAEDPDDPADLSVLADTCRLSLIAVAAAIGIAVPAASAQGSAAPAAQRGCSLNPPPPAGFTENKVEVNGIGINYVRGGHGPTLLLLHGYPQTWYSWDDILPALARHYTVVAPDLPGAGLSDAPAAATDYTFPALTANGPGLWWFGLFDEPNGLAEQLMTGREQQWVTGFMPTIEVVKGSVTACDMAVYAHFLEQPGHLRASIEWFATLPQDVKNDAVYQKTKLTMPVLAVGASASLGSFEAKQAREYATSVTGVVIPDSGHWIYEEHPAELTRSLLQFLGGMAWTLT